MKKKNVEIAEVKLELTASYVYEDVDFGERAELKLDNFFINLSLFFNYYFLASSFKQILIISSRLKDFLSIFSITLSISLVLYPNT